MEQLDSSLFDWLTWRSGTPLDVFNLSCRKEDLTSPIGKLVLTEFAIGWCHGENIPCRPKTGTIAVMFCKNEVCFWFHFYIEEVKLIFNLE